MGATHGELGVALIGCGDIGGLRADVVGEAAGSRLAVTCDTDASRAEAVAARLSADAETDATAALARSDVDLAIVSTPPSSHAAIGCAALEAGVHALI